MTADRRTLAAYAARIDDYLRLLGDDPPEGLDDFVAALPAGGRVLDLGCGPGREAARMQAAGLEVEAWDASPEMAAAARARFGVDARCRGFADLDAEAAFDGVWAAFSLLHAPRDEMPGHLARIARALRPGGILVLALKTGTGAHRDALGRAYTYYTADELDRLLAAAGFTVLDKATGAGAGLAGTVEPWIRVTARA